MQNKTIGFIQNGSWAPLATKVMKEMLEKSKNLTYTENNVTIFTALDTVRVLLDVLEETTLTISTIDA